jgi:ADP-heptose:LPS heptosyltransferase
LLNKKIIITGAKSEIEYNKSLEKELKKRKIDVLNLTGKTDFLQLIDIFKRVDYLISGDTSIVHLAAFTPLKSITIFLGNAYHYHTCPP